MSQKKQKVLPNVRSFAFLGCFHTDTEMMMVLLSNDVVRNGWTIQPKFEEIFVWENTDGGIFESNHRGENKIGTSEHSDYIEL